MDSIATADDTGEIMRKYPSQKSRSWIIYKAVCLLSGIWGLYASPMLQCSWTVYYILHLFKFYCANIRLMFCLFVRGISGGSFGLSSMLFFNLCVFVWRLSRSSLSALQANHNGTYQGYVSSNVTGYKFRVLHVMGFRGFVTSSFVLHF